MSGKRSASDLHGAQADGGSPRIFATCEFVIDEEDFWGHLDIGVGGSETHGEKNEGDKDDEPSSDSDEEQDLPPVLWWNVGDFEVQIANSDADLAEKLATCLDGFMKRRAADALETWASQSESDAESSAAPLSAAQIVAREKQILCSVGNGSAPDANIAPLLEFVGGDQHVRVATAVRTNIENVLELADSMSNISSPDGFLAPCLGGDATATFGYAWVAIDFSDLALSGSSESICAVFCAKAMGGGSSVVTDIGHYASRDMALEAMASDIDAHIRRHGIFSSREVTMSALGEFLSAASPTEADLDLLDFPGEAGVSPHISASFRRDEAKLHRAAILFASTPDWDDATFVSYKLVEVPRDAFTPGRAVKSARKL
jgi:hypothetical protein